MHSGWQTSQHIIGVHPKYKYDIVYYIQMAKTDDSKIQSPYDVKNQMVFRNASGQNPYHFVECEGVSSNFEPIATGSNTALGRVFGSVDVKSSCYFGVANSELMYSAKQNGSEIITNKTNIYSVGEGNIDFLVRTIASGGRIMSQFTSFADLYNYLNIIFTLYDYKHIEGCNATSDRLYFYPDAVDRGERFAEQIMNGIVLSSDNIKFSHVPTIAVDDGIAYVTFQASPEDVETGTGTSVFLAQITLSDNSVEYTKIAGLGSIGGMTFDGACTNPVMYLDSTNGYIYILYSAHANETVYECVCKYTISSGDIENSICQIAVASTDYDFSVGNFNEKIGIPNGIKAISTEVVMSVPKLSNGVYYSAMSSGNFKDSITAILKSTDLETWEVYTVLPALCGSDCECVIAIDNGYIYGASRHLYKDFTLCVWKLSMSTLKVVDSVQIPDCATKPTWYTHTNGNLYLLHGLSGRKVLEWIGIDKSHLAQSYNFAECKRNRNLGYNSVATDGTDVYIAIQNSNGYDSPRIRVAKLIWS